MSLIEKALEKATGKAPKKGPAGSAPQVSGGAAPSDSLPDGAVERRTKASRLMAVNKSYLVSRGMVTPETGYTPIAQQFRRIKQPILKKAFSGAPGANNNIVVVTSTGSNEGKSFVCINLAVSIAMELDRTVLLIDADATKKAIARILFDLPEESPGLQDLIAGTVKEVADVMLRADIKRLTVIPAGATPSSIPEQLSSAAMKSIMREIAARYSNRLIIVDSPPISAGSEATILSELAGQILFVVEAEKTVEHHVEEALKQIDRSKVTGLILNKSNQRETGSLYTEYDSYGQYGRGTSSAPEAGEAG